MMFLAHCVCVLGELAAFAGMMLGAESKFDLYAGVAATCFVIQAMMVGVRFAQGSFSFQEILDDMAEP